MESGPSSDYVCWDLTVKRFKDTNHNVFYCMCEINPKEQYLLDKQDSGISTSSTRSAYDISTKKQFQIPSGFRPSNFDGSANYKKFYGLLAYTWVASSFTDFIPALAFGTCDQASYQSSGDVPSSWSSSPFALLSYNGIYVRPAYYAESSGWYMPDQHWFSNITLESNLYQCDYTG